MRIFWDERGYEVTENQLADEYSEGVRKGYIDPGITFYQWINNCTDKNGTLTEIKNKKETGKMGKEYKGFTLSDNWAKKKEAMWRDRYGSTINQHHVITVKYGGLSTKFDFWGSRVHPGIETEADLLDAFSCFVSDAIAGVDDFSMFCGEFGYDEYEDAGKALKTWKACQRANEKLTRIYPGDLWDLANELDKMNR